MYRGNDRGGGMGEGPGYSREGGEVPAGPWQGVAGKGASRVTGEGVAE